MDNSSSSFTYEIQLFIDGKDYSSYIKYFNIHKDMTTRNFATEYMVLQGDVSFDLGRKLGKTLTLQIRDTSEGSKKQVIFKNNFELMSSSITDTGDVQITFDTLCKKRWVDRFYFSKVYDNIKVHECVEQHIKSVDTEANCVKPTEIFYATTKNLNTFTYEKILAYHEESNFGAIKQLVNKYSIFNAPTYIFFDEYNFGYKYKKHNWQRFGFYDLTSPTALRKNNAVLKGPMQTYNIIEGPSSYITKKIYKLNFQSIYNLKQPYHYISKRSKQPTTLDMNAEYKYTPNSISDEMLRIDTKRKFYSQAAEYIILTLNNVNIVETELGTRAPLSSSKIQSQYLVTMVDIMYEFQAMESSKDKYSNAFVCTATINSLVYGK